jgi:hypothetical protein
MELVQIRLPGGSYADVDATLVDAYIRGDFGDVYKGSIRTSDLPEFQGDKVVERYNEDKTVTYDDGSQEEAYKAVNYYTPPGNAEVKITNNSGDDGDNGESSVGIEYDFGTGLALARGMYGFMPESIIEEFAKAWTKSGDASIAIAMTRETSQWQKEFGYLLRDDGSLIMSEINAVATIATYKQTLGEIGINDFSNFEDQFKELVAGEVSGEEFQSRIDTVYAGVINQIPEVEALFRDRYNIALDAPTIFGALINPDIQDKVLAGDISTLQIAGQAKAAGFTDTFASFEALRKAGLTQNQAKDLYQSAGQVLGQADRLGMDLNIDTLESAAIGDTKAQETLARLSGAVATESSAVLGSVKNQGRITGLLEE